MLFLPILVNVVVITIAIKFQGTPVITLAMLLANLWLGAASVAAFFFAVRGVALKGAAGALVGVGVLSGAMVVAAWVREARRG